MPQTKAAKKALRASLRKRQRNLFWKNRIKKTLKEIKKALKTKSDNIEELVLQAISLIDKAAGKGVIHKNTAARKKSRLLKSIEKALGKPFEFKKKAKKTKETPTKTKKTSSKKKTTTENSKKSNKKKN